MAGKYLTLRRLDAQLQKFSEFKALPFPSEGWIQKIRSAMGMTAEQLANRLGVSRPRVHRIEKDEVAGALTIRTMREVAEALDCVFVYALVPKSSLESMVVAQAKAVAKEQIEVKVWGEESQEDIQQAYNEAVAELVGKMPRALWGMAKAEKAQI